jgi:hypothetical protein
VNQGEWYWPTSDKRRRTGRRAKGCDMRAHAANGETLLHIATNAADLNFIHYMLDQGMAANTPGRFEPLGQGHHLA